MLVSCRQKNVYLQANEWRMRQKQKEKQRSRQNRLLSVALLLAMMPMFLVTSLHVHEFRGMIAGDDCEICVGNEHHAAHLTAGFAFPSEKCHVCNLLSTIVMEMPPAQFSVANMRFNDSQMTFVERTVTESVGGRDVRGPPAES